MTPTQRTHELTEQHDDARLQRALRPHARDRARMSRLRLHLSATPEEVPYARAAITRLCEHLEIDDERTTRIRLAITEACTNCVLHAYKDDADSPSYVLDARVERRALRVVVCDRGVGIPDARRDTSGSLGFGLGLIEALADSTDISPRPGGGTRILMRFDMPSAA